MMGKRLKYGFLYFLAQYFGPVVVGAIGRTLRIRVEGLDRWEKLHAEGKYIFATLHGRMFVPIWIMRRKGITALVSQSRDGEIITRLIMGLGYGTVRGSSNRGALAAVRGLLNALKRGPVAILVDGPRGPVDEPKIGTIAVARASGYPILPLAGSASPAFEFGSWDRFQLPKPFSKGAVAIGEPFIIPEDVKGEELEQWRVELKNRLLALRERADQLAREGT